MKELGIGIKSNKNLKTLNLNFRNTGLIKIENSFI